MKLKKFPWKGIFAAILTIITASWAADALKGEALFSEWFPVLKNYQVLVTVGSILLFLISFFWLFKHRQSFFAVRRLSQRQCEPHSHLILLLTSPNIPPPSPFGFPLKLSDKFGNTAILNGTCLRDDILVLNTLNFWNWQQILRGIEPHSKLQHIYLIGSKDSKKIRGSFNFLSEAETFIKKYYPSVWVDRVTQPVDFEDFDELVKIIEEAVEVLKKEGAKEKDIIIDVTGGLKIPSIAGAAVTLRREVTFQYVRTDPIYDDVRDVLAYDVVVQSAVSV